MSADLFGLEQQIPRTNSCTAKGMETVLAMLQARQVAEELMKALWQESTEGLMLRNAYLAAANGELPTAH